MCGIARGTPSGGRMRHHQGTMADPEKPQDQAPTEGVLGNLPATRPGRRSTRRAGSDDGEATTASASSAAKAGGAKGATTSSTKAGGAKRTTASATKAGGTKKATTTKAGGTRKATTTKAGGTKGTAGSATAKAGATTPGPSPTTTVAPKAARPAGAKKVPPARPSQQTFPFCRAGGDRQSPRSSREAQC